MKQTLVGVVAQALRGFFPNGELRGKTVLAALSGGADSVCLTLVLQALADDFGYRLVCAHVHHGIRGAEADRDEAFSREFCQKRDIPFYSARFDVPQLAQNEGKSLEEAARDVRYAYFRELLDGGTADYVATAHTASDNAETVLLQLARGCGLTGLCGIPPVRGRLFRPLLGVTREQVEAYLAENGQDYVTDSTNASDDYARNRLRHTVLPVLKELNPSFEKTLTRNGEVLRRENDYLGDLANKTCGATDDLSELAKADPVLLARTLRRRYFDAAGVYPDAAHIETLEHAIRSWRPSDGAKRYEFPNGVSAVLSGGRLTFSATKDERRDRAPESYDICVKKGQTIRCGDWLLRLDDAGDGQAPDGGETFQNIYSLFMECGLFSAIIKGKIRVRGRAPGDRILQGGMHKSVKKLLCDRKVAQDERAGLPVLCDDSGVLFLPYIGLCDGHAKREGSPDLTVRLYKSKARSDQSIHEKKQ